MLESAAYAFGWINPLLRQMAPSPCRADKPQSARHPLLHFCVCICVYMCFTKKKKHWQVCCGEDGEWICFGFGMCLCMCTCIESSVS